MSSSSKRKSRESPSAESFGGDTSRSPPPVSTSSKRKYRELRSALSSGGYTGSSIPPTTQSGPSQDQPDQQSKLRTEIPSSETLLFYRTVLSTAYDYTLLVQQQPRPSRAAYETLEEDHLKQVKDSLDDPSNTVRLRDTFWQFHDKFEKWRHLFTILQDQRFCSDQAPEQRAESARTFWLKREEIRDTLKCHVKDIRSKASGQPEKLDAAKQAFFSELQGTEDLKNRLGGLWDKLEERLLWSLQHDYQTRVYIGELFPESRKDLLGDVPDTPS